MQSLTVMLFGLDIVRLLVQVYKDGFECDATKDIPESSFVATATKVATYVSDIIQTAL